MSEFDYESWWALHLRIAKGESLSAQETTAYESGLIHLEGQAAGTDETLTYLRSLRAAINRGQRFIKTLPPAAPLWTARLSLWNQPISSRPAKYWT